MAKESHTDSFQYTTKGIHLDLGTAPEHLDVGACWKLQGVDGRFSDAARRFPGFSKLAYTVSVDNNSRDTVYDVSASSNYYLFKFVSIPKPGTQHVLRGFVVGIDRVGYPDQVDLIFLHFDTQDNLWYTYRIAPISTTWYTSDEFDAAAVGTVLCVSVTGKENVTAYWQYDHDWDATAEEENVLTTGALITDTMGKTFPESLVEVDAAAFATGYTSGYLARTSGKTGYRRIRFRFFHPARNLWTNISDEHSIYTGTSSVGKGYRVRFNKATLMTDWVSKGWTRLYVYRTVEDGGTYYLEQIVRWPYDLTGTGRDNDQLDDFMTNNTADASGYHNVIVGGRTEDNASSPEDIHTPTGTVSGRWGSHNWSLGMNDLAATFQVVYDPFLDDTGDPPLGGLLTAYGDQLIMRGFSSSDGNKMQSTVHWSTLFHGEAENFPSADHYYNPPVPGSKVLSLVDAGDYCFAVRDDSVVRLHRNSNIMSVNELYRKVGGVSRYGATAVGQALFVVTEIGLMRVDGTSGRQDLVGAVERLFLDPDVYWADTLTSVHMAFDGSLGALILLNTTKEEMYLLWFDNSVITSLVECPFQYMTEGLRPDTGGSLRTFFLGPQGDIFLANANRSAPRQTMCGALASEQVTGVVTDTSPRDLRINTLAGNAITPPTSAVGFYVHALTGVNRGFSRKIDEVGVGAANEVSVGTAFPNLFAVGDKVSVAPISYAVGLWSLRTSSMEDLFTRKRTHQMGARIRPWNGEIDPQTNSALLLTLGSTNDPYGRAVENDTLMWVDTARNWVNIPNEGDSLWPLVRQDSSDADFELLGVEVRGTIDETTVSGSA